MIIKNLLESSRFVSFLWQQCWRSGIFSSNPVFFFYYYFIAETVLLFLLSSKWQTLKKASSSFLEQEHCGDFFFLNFFLSIFFKKNQKMPSLDSVRNEEESEKWGNVSEGSHSQNSSLSWNNYYCYINYYYYYINIISIIK